MLHELQIESFGLIERADVEFAKGATIFTGETGSGKTMLIGALDFVLGARAGPDVVRRGAARAQVTLVFDPNDRLRARLTADGFEIDGGESATITREIGESGRSTTRVNGRPSTASYVREIRDGIAELIGQHEAQRLLSPNYHLDLLDRFAGDAAARLRKVVAQAYARAQTAVQALASLERDERLAEQRYEDARFAIAEIEAARLEPSEIERLHERRTYLENTERIAVALQGAREALAAEEGGAIGALGTASVALAGIAAFDGALRSAQERAANCQADAIELAAEVARAFEAAEYDPAELDAINARLDTIERLKRKYGETVEAIAVYAQRARELIDEYEGRDRYMAQLQAEAAAAAGALEDAAAALSDIRVGAIATLRNRMIVELAELALASGRFDVSIEPLERAGPNGGERVEFLFAANTGEAARPLSRVASGGELSRVLLALVVALAGARESSSALVFDEIDAGIGGATATAVGARIGELARRGQVLCVTHLAQLATWAQRHYRLDKLERSGATVITVRAIDNAKERETEIARMLSGESHDVALRHARALLARNKAS